jgi:hypothetical protein
MGRGDGHGDAFFVDVHADVMHDFVHGCLVSFIDDESGASHASHIAGRSAHADNPRNPNQNTRSSTLLSHRV